MNLPQHLLKLLLMAAVFLSFVAVFAKPIRRCRRECKDRGPKYPRCRQVCQVTRYRRNLRMKESNNSII
ncbi:hypothetical protein X975_12031, partial [Stegodyphus mimosarum]